MKRICVLLTLALGAVPAGAGHAATLRVPSDYPGIYSAFRAAQYGDTVLVAPGTYTYYAESCRWIPDGVVLTSEEGPAATILEAHWFDLRFGIIEFDPSGSHELTELSGFTIVPMDCWDCCAIACDTPPGATPLIRNNVIVAAPEPSEELWMAVVSCNGASPRILNNTIVGALEPIQINGAGATPIISHNIMVSLLPGSCDAILCATGTAPQISCNDIWGFPVPYWGSCGSTEGDFFEDPLFCHPELRDYSLREDSPAVHGYGCGLVGALPVGCEVTSVEQGSWGTVKARFQ